MSEPQNMVIGTAGELRVMSELLLRDFNPAKSYLDNGIDIILSNGNKIQVKTAMYKQIVLRGPCVYRFELRKGNRKKNAQVIGNSGFVEK